MTDDDLVKFKIFDFLKKKYYSITLRNRIGIFFPRESSQVKTNLSQLFPLDFVNESPRGYGQCQTFRKKLLVYPKCIGALAVLFQGCASSRDQCVQLLRVHPSVPRRLCQGERRNKEK